MFLVHENAESKSGQKRIFQHNYSTKGAGRMIEEAMRTKVFKAMKSFMYGKMIFSVLLSVKIKPLVDHGFKEEN